MTSGQRTALSLLISVLLFAGFTVLAFAGLFSVLETRFYQPTILSSLKTQLKDTSVAFDEYTDAHMLRFSAFLQSTAVKSCVNANQNAQDIEERTQLAGVLLSETSGLQGIRLIDSGGRRIHYSTFSRDIMRMQASSISYNNYVESGELALETIVAPDGTEPRIILDSEYNRIIYSYPFYDSLDLYRGTLLFYINASDFYRYTVIKGIMQLSESARLVTLPNGFSGFVMGLPLSGSELLLESIDVEYSKALQDVTKLLLAEGGDWMLLANSDSPNASFANVFREDILLFSNTLKILLLICVFVTLFLSILLIFNVKHDDTVIIKDRIKRFQFALLNEYLEKKQEVDWQKISSDIQRRKLDAINDVKKSLGRKAKRHEELVDSLLEKSWDEIFSSISKQSQASSTQQVSINTQEIRQMLEEILVASKNISVSSSQVARVSTIEDVKTVEDTEEVQELTDVSEVEELTDADEVEELTDADEVEELTDADEVEELIDADEVQELTDADEVEELTDAAELEELTDADEVEELIDADEVQELTDADEVEELTDVEEVQELTDAEEVEELTDANEVEELTDADEVEELTDADEVEELTDADEVQELSNTEEIQEETIEQTKYKDVIDYSKFDEAVEQANLEAEEEQGLENPLLINEEDAKVLTEELKFGDVEVKEESLVEENQIDFDVIVPDFSELDEDEIPSAKEELSKVYSNVETEIEAKEDSKVEEDNKEEILAEYTELESADVVDLIDDTAPFSFAMKFAPIQNAIEIKKAETIASSSDEIIQESDDGLFVIPDVVKTDNVEIDEDFQNLVDSIL